MDNMALQDLFPFNFAHHRKYHSLSLQLSGDACRGQAEDFVQQRFLSAYGADIHLFMPELLSLRDSHGRLSAVAGIRLASREALFLENYLAEPVETSISRLIGSPVSRDQVVEVGNLTSVNAGNARLIIIAVTWLLCQRGGPQS